MCENDFMTGLVESEEVILAYLNCKPWSGSEGKQQRLGHRALGYISLLSLLGLKTMAEIVEQYLVTRPIPCGHHTENHSFHRACRHTDMVYIALKSPT